WRSGGRNAYRVGRGRPAGRSLGVVAVMAWGTTRPTAVAPDLVVEEASRQIATMGGGSCSVLTTYLPQVTWYSGCAAVLLPRTFDSARVERLSGPNRFLLLFDHGKRQPESDALTGYLGLTEGPRWWCPTQ
ncbi:MAG: hypothetical protein ACRDVM_01465, partial [Acidimicrobiia bacterium]